MLVFIGMYSCKILQIKMRCLKIYLSIYLSIYILDCTSRDASLHWVLLCVIRIGILMKGVSIANDTLYYILYKYLCHSLCSLLFASLSLSLSLYLSISLSLPLSLTLRASESQKERKGERKSRRGRGREKRRERDSEYCIVSRLKTPLQRLRRTMAARWSHFMAWFWIKF